jgi:hypothetical protein
MIKILGSRVEKLTLIALNREQRNYLQAITASDNEGSQEDTFG